MAADGTGSWPVTSYGQLKTADAAERASATLLAASSGTRQRRPATSASADRVAAPPVAGPQVGQHAHDDRRWPARVRGGGRPTPAARWAIARTAPARRLGSQRRAGERVDEAPSGPSASPTRKCIGIPMPTHADAGPSADLDHHRGQQDREPAPAGQHDVEERVARVVVVAGRRRRTRRRRTGAGAAPSNDPLGQPAASSSSAASAAPSSVAAAQHGRRSPARRGRAGRAPGRRRPASPKRSSRATAPARIHRAANVPSGTFRGHVPRCLRRHPARQAGRRSWPPPARCRRSPSSTPPPTACRACCARPACSPATTSRSAWRTTPATSRSPWGCHYAGAIYTAASSRLTSGELAYILDDCEAKVFITSKYKADQAAEIVADTPGCRAAADARRHDRRLRRPTRTAVAAPAARRRSPTASPAPTCSTRRARPACPRASPGRSSPSRWRRPAGPVLGLLQLLFGTSPSSRCTCRPRRCTTPPRCASAWQPTASAAPSS